MMHYCEKCKENFKYENSNTYFNDGGYGYSTKLVNCPQCNTPYVIRYIEDETINLNEDERYYIY